MKFSSNCDLTGRSKSKVDGLEISNGGKVVATALVADKPVTTKAQEVVTSTIKSLLTTVLF